MVPDFCTGQATTSRKLHCVPLSA